MSKTDVNQTEMLEALAVQGAAGWKPNEGDTIMGTIQSITASNPGQYGIYPIVTLLTQDGEIVNVHAFHNTLRNRLLQQRPKIGEKVAIQYLGRVQSKDKNRSPYYNYAVVIGDPTKVEEAGWDTFDSEGAPTVAAE